MPLSSYKQDIKKQHKKSNSRIFPEQGFVFRVGDPCVRTLSKCEKNIAKHDRILRKYINEKENGTYSFMVGSNEYFIPLSESVNIDLEIEKLQKELDYTVGFLKIVKGKLSNAKFVQNAPSHLVENEKNKLADAELKINILSEKISSLSND